MAKSRHKKVHRFKLPIRKEETLREFVRVSFGVQIPDVQVCENHTTPWRAFADAYFARSPVAVWKASRGFGGKSFLLALLGLVEACSLKASVSVLGGSGEQSARVHEYMTNFWDYKRAPVNLLASDPVKRETKLVYGNHIRALMASTASVRGPHPQRLRLDEADETSIIILDSALGQPMDTHNIKSQTVLSSTHQYAQGTMTEILKRAKVRGWPVYQWCYKETLEPHGWLLRSNLEAKRQTVTQAMWDAEYDLQDPAPGSRAIVPAKTEIMFDASLGQYEGRLDELIIVEPPEKRARYTTGADWAKEKDYTVIITFRTDCMPWRLVAYERTGRQPWPLMVQKYNDRVRMYPGQAAHDGTGLGDVIDDYIEVDATGVQMVGKPRSNMLSNYIAAIEREEIRAPRIESMYGEHLFASRADVYSGGRVDHLPDSIAAGALAYGASSRAGWARGSSGG